MDKNNTSLPLNFNLEKAYADIEHMITEPIEKITETNIELANHLYTGALTFDGLNTSEKFSSVHVFGSHKNPPALASSASLLKADKKTHKIGVKNITPNTSSIINEHNFSLSIFLYFIRLSFP
jgi:hypothetical protein